MRRLQFFFLILLKSLVANSADPEINYASMSPSEAAETRFRTGEDKSVENFRKIDIKTQIGLIASDSGYMVIRDRGRARAERFFEDDVKIYQKVRALLTPEQLDTLNTLTYGYAMNLNVRNGFPKSVVINGKTYSSLQEMRDNLWTLATQNDPKKMNAALCKNLLRMALKIQSGQNLNIKSLSNNIIDESEIRLKAHGASIPQTCTEVVDGKQITFGLTETIHAYKMEAARNDYAKKPASSVNASAEKSIDSVGSYCTKNEVTTQVNQTIDYVNANKKIMEIGVFNIENGCRLLMYLRKQKTQWTYFDYGQGIPTDQIVGVLFATRDELISAIMEKQSPIPKLPAPPQPGTIPRPSGLR